jgi:NADH-quinone oxidoreductase subunit G
VVDLCPVGSLLSKDFLHKARAWDLDKTPSVCPGCTQGCNITVDTRDSAVVRLRPRPNLDVNRHFICDTGRADYRWMNRGDRIEAPLVRDGDRHRAVDWDAALARVAAGLRGARGRAVILASGRASTEALGHVRALLEGLDVTAAVRVPRGEEAPLAGIPGLALRAERAPNLHGARLFGYDDDFAGALAAAAGAAVVVLLDAQLAPAEQAALAGAGLVIVLGTVADDALPGAEVVLPVATMVEESGTFVNRDGRVQRFLPARAAPGMARPAWWAAAAAAERLGRGAAPATAAAAFAALGAMAPALAGLDHATLGLTGRTLEAAGAAR